MPRLDDDFVPALGFSDANAQTVFGSVARLAPKPRVVRERRRTPDGDFIDVDVLEGRPGAPTVLLLHGLEGSSDSGYIRTMLQGLAARGWGAAALNFRGCSGQPNLQAASYSSGDYRDALEVARALPHPKAAAGFSLGGSVLLNMLAQRGAEAALDAAVAVSVPFDLSACADFIDSGEPFAGIYRSRFLATLKPKAVGVARRFAGAVDEARVHAAQTLRAHDDAVTAPLFGFTDAEDYYRRCSTGPQLGAITTPTLLVSAEDDPLAPAAHLPAEAAAGEVLHVLRTRFGGHVGFVEGSVLRPGFYAERMALAWLGTRFAG